MKNAKRKSPDEMLQTVDREESLEAHRKQLDPNLLFTRPLVDLDRRLEKPKSTRPMTVASEPRAMARKRFNSKYLTLSFCLQ